MVPAQPARHRPAAWAVATPAGLRGRHSRAGNSARHAGRDFRRRPGRPRSRPRAPARYSVQKSDVLVDLGRSVDATVPTYVESRVMLRALFSFEFDPSEEAEGSIDPLDCSPITIAWPIGYCLPSPCALEIRALLRRSRSPHASPTNGTATLLLPTASRFPASGNGLSSQPLCAAAIPRKPTARPAP